MTHSDIIIVGAGSAGCVLAHQLVTHGIDVTLVEPDSESAPRADRLRPSRWIQLLGSAEDWSLPTASSPKLASRRLTWPRGRGLGGSSRINSMIWFPPTDRDWQNLSAAVGPSWQIDSVKRSFAAVDSIVRPEGPRWLSRSAQYFLDAASQVDPDAPMIYQRVTREGRRWTPVRLLEELPPPAAGKLCIVRASVARVVFKNDKAVGVQTDASETPIECNQGVVLCGGAIATPAILMRSGLGPKSLLRELAIDVRHDCDGIGGNLHDHLIMPVLFGLRSGERFEPSPTTRDIVRWQTLGIGPVSSNIAECGGLFDDASLQIHLTPTHYLKHPRPDAPPAMTIGVNVTQPQSRGRLSIVSTDPNQPPEIEPNYLAHPSDLESTIRGVHVCRQIAANDPLRRWQTGELVPGPKRLDDESIARSISRYAQTLYHPVGTCAAGPRSDSVVDSTLGVRGAERLWVADASVLPVITTGNPNAMVMTIALHFSAWLRSKIGK